MSVTDLRQGPVNAPGRRGRPTSSRRSRTRRWRVVREVVLIVTAIVLYFLVRGLIDSRIAVAFRNAEHVVRLEQTAGLFVEPDLQDAVVQRGWVIEAANYVYIYGHWPVVALTLAWLLLRHRDAYGRFRNAILISGAIGLLIFALFPVAPPRFLDGYGFVDTVTEQTTAYRVLQPPAFVNQYAAVPSLHFGWNLLMGIAWAGLAGSWVGRLFGWLMPPAMLAAIVLTANHYVFDGIAGGLIALLGLVLATRIMTKQSDRPAGGRVRSPRRPVGTDQRT